MTRMSDAHLVSHEVGLCFANILVIFLLKLCKSLLLSFLQENFNELKGALEGADHSWTALTLKVYFSPLINHTHGSISTCFSRCLFQFLQIICS